MKKTLSLLLVLAILLSVEITLAACSKESVAITEATTQSQSGNITYSVTVTDVGGNPHTSDVLVRFLKDGEQIAIEPVDDNGIAAKELEAGEYTFELVFTGDANAYYYDQNDLTLSIRFPDRVVPLSRRLTAECTPLYVQGNETKAYKGEVGGMYVSLISGQRNYFLFVPTVAGTYRVSSDNSTQVGYYGMPYFVQEQTALDVVDNTFIIDVSAGNIGCTYVIGVDAGDATACVLSVIRIGDPQRSIADEPWLIYEASVKPQPFRLTGTGKLIDFDLTAKGYNLVRSESDGFYHLDSVDGPLVLVRLGTASRYLESFKKILEQTSVRRYFFDEEGTFIKKESYSECLLEYIACMDENKGVYPLTDDLMYIIQQEGEDSGWWDPSNSSYIFVDGAGRTVPEINTEIAWLFMCCYLQ